MPVLTIIALPVTAYYYYLYILDLIQTDSTCFIEAHTFHARHEPRLTRTGVSLVCILKRQDHRPHTNKTRWRICSTSTATQNISLTMNKLLRLGRRVLSRSVEPPCVFVEHAYENLDLTVNIEEEHMPAYEKGLFYPVQIGQVFNARYQILSKLGYGANSTVWFCRDLLYELFYIPSEGWTKDTQYNKQASD